MVNTYMHQSKCSDHSLLRDKFSSEAKRWNLCLVWSNLSVVCAGKCRSISEKLNLIFVLRLLVLLFWYQLCVWVITALYSCEGTRNSWHCKCCSIHLTQEADCCVHRPVSCQQPLVITKLLRTPWWVALPLAHLMRIVNGQMMCSVSLGFQV